MAYALSSGKILSTYVCACIHAQLLQSCLTLCAPMDYSLPGSSVHGILRARNLEWVIMPSSRGLPHPEIELESPAAPVLQVDSLPTQYKI